MDYSLRKFLKQFNTAYMRLNPYSNGLLSEGFYHKV